MSKEVFLGKQRKGSSPGKQREIQRPEGFADPDGGARRTAALVKYLNSKPNDQPNFIALQEVFATTGARGPIFDELRQCGYIHKHAIFENERPPRWDCCSQAFRVLANCGSQCAPLCILCWCRAGWSDCGLGVVSDRAFVFRHDVARFINYGPGNLDDFASEKGALYNIVGVGNHFVHVYNTHLQASYRDLPSRKLCQEMRITQLDALFNHMKEVAKKDDNPIILLGDFNINGAAHLDAFYELVCRRNPHIVRFQLLDFVEYVCHIHGLRTWELAKAAIIACLPDYCKSLAKRPVSFDVSALFDENGLCILEKELTQALDDIRPHLDHLYDDKGKCRHHAIIRRLHNCINKDNEGVSYKGYDITRNLRRGMPIEFTDEADYKMFPTRHSFFAKDTIHRQETMGEVTGSCLRCCNYQPIEPRRLGNGQGIEGEWDDYAFIFNCEQGELEAFLIGEPILDPGYLNDIPGYGESNEQKKPLKADVEAPLEGERKRRGGRNGSVFEDDGRPPAARVEASPIMTAGDTQEEKVKGRLALSDHAMLRFKIRVAESEHSGQLNHLSPK